MSELLLNDHAVLAAVITLPRVGAWTARLELDHDEAVTGAVTLRSADGALNLRGTVRRGGVAEGYTGLLVVGGNGTLPTELVPRFYRGVTLRVPVTDALRDAGEALAADADATLLDNTVLDAWTRPRELGGTVLTDLTQRYQAAWRFRDDGTVWVGHETWPSVAVDYDVVADAPAQDRVEIATETVPAALRPGTTFRDRPVSVVEYHHRPNAARTVVQFERPGASTDRLTAAVESAVRHTTREVIYHALYPARVVQQRGDGTLEVELADPRMPHMTGIPIRGSAPGEHVQVRNDARVLIGFEGGDPTKPYAAGWLGNDGVAQSWTLEASTIKLGANATRGVARLNDPIGAGTLTATVLVGGAPVPVQFTYIPLGGAPQPASPTVVLTGKITDASTKATAE
ncbi:MAG: hypothetical protein JO152_10025 [Mycobacteriaceae bacterium]|nr:hypothetical protein [Mycobacteriaceae bacterium]